MSKWLDSLPANVRAEIEAQTDDYIDHLKAGLDAYFAEDLAKAKQAVSLNIIKRQGGRWYVFDHTGRRRCRAAIRPKASRQTLR